MQRLLVLAVFLADVAAIASTFVLAAAVYARATGLALERAVIGFGPVVVRGTLLGVPVSLHLAPFTSHVVPHPSPAADAPDVPADDVDRARAAARVAAGEARRYDALSLPARAGFALLSLAVGFVIASVALGPGAALAAARDDLGRIALGLFGPFSTAREALARAEGVLQAGGALHLARRLTGTMLAAHALTFWPNLLYLARTRKDAHGKVAIAFLLGNMLVVAVWLVAILGWLFSR